MRVVVSMRGPCPPLSTLLSDGRVAMDTVPMSTGYEGRSDGHFLFTLK